MMSNYKKSPLYKVGIGVNFVNDAYSSPSWPMASTGQLSKASTQSSISFSVEGCFFTKDASESLMLPKISGAISRQSPQEMHWLST